MSGALWRNVVDRLSNEAARRSGAAIEDPGVLTLRPPQEGGELVRVTLYTDESGTDQTVIVTTGFAHRLAASLNDPDDRDYVCAMVVAVLDGHAAELAEVAADGTWLNVASVVETPDGVVQRGTHVAPALYLKGLPVDHEHRRQIEPWPRPAINERL